MTPPPMPGFAAARVALWVAGAAGVAGAGLAFLAPSVIGLAYRLAVFAVLAPAVGCLLLTLIHRTTGGQWASSLAPFLQAGAGLVPWVWLFAIPLLFLKPPPGADPRWLSHAGLGYDSFAMLAARTVLFAALFFGYRREVSAGVGRNVGPRRNPRPWVGPVGLIVLFFVLTIVADDWLASLKAGWHSTGFGVVWIVGQAASGLALALLCGLAAGGRPSASGAAGRPLGIDWGNLLLATLVFWCYVTFAQFLIIWAGDKPDETSWFLERERGGWAYVFAVLGVLGFAAPFLMLLSRRLKGTVAGLACAAALVLATQLAYMVWLIVPLGGGLSPGGAALVACLLAAGAGLFFNRFASAARRLA